MISFALFHATAQQSKLGFDIKTSPGFYKLKPFRGTQHQYSSALGWALGIGVCYEPVLPFFVSTGIFFNRIHYKTDYDFIITLRPNDPLVPVKADVRADCLEVPLLLNFSLQRTEKTNIYLNGGFVASFLLSDKDRTTFGNGEIRRSGYLQSKVSGLQFGAGLRHRLNKNVGLIFEPQYRLFTSKLDQWMGKNSSAFYATVGLFFKKEYRTLP